MSSVLLLFWTLQTTRYIHVDNKPVILVYNPAEIPNISKTFSTWRAEAKRVGIGEVLIWVMNTAGNTVESLGIAENVDAAVEFPPHNTWVYDIGIKDLQIYTESAFIFNYRKIVKIMCDKNNEINFTNPSVPLYKGVMTGWDNAARRKDGFFSFYGYSLKSFYDWCMSTVTYTERNFTEENRFMFVNAWNEWAEGTYLEPDEKFGYANINTFSKALYKLPFDDNLVVLGKGGIVNRIAIKNKTFIAIHIHLFYTELIDEIIDNINHIPIKFDCFVSTDTEEKCRLIKNKFRSCTNAEKLSVGVYSNRGRDVAPFLVQMTPTIQSYKYICHIHSKKTSTGEYGNNWRKYLYKHLLGSSSNVLNIVDVFEKDSSIGLIFPEAHPTLWPQYEWGGNKEGCKLLLKRIGTPTELPEDPVFPVGNMFWARVDAIIPMFLHSFNGADFPEENGQTNSTLAHVIERSWVYVSKNKGYGYRIGYNANLLYKRKSNHLKGIAIYAHYDPEGRVSAEEITLLKSIKNYAEFIYFVSNSPLDKDSMVKVAEVANNILVRENKGYDFGAWQAGLINFGFDRLKEFDRLILLNNSIIGPVHGLDRMFDSMSEKGLDFWGVTLFPELPDGSYINRAIIPEHIQSYFQVYESGCFKSDVFKSIWQTMPCSDDYISTIGNIESQLTKQLSDYGFIYDVYINESSTLCHTLGDYSLPYTNPFALLLLGSPFIKKKMTQHASISEKARVNYFLRQVEFGYEFPM